MADAFDIAKDALKMLGATIDGIEIIKKLIPSMPESVGFAVGVVIDALEEGFSGKTSPEMVNAQLKAHHDAIAAGDTAAQKAIHDRFDGGGETP